MIHREQSFGEIRGLRRLKSALAERVIELQNKLGEGPTKPITINEEI